MSTQATDQNTPKTPEALERERLEKELTKRGFDNEGRPLPDGPHNKPHDPRAA